MFVNEDKANTKRCCVGILPRGPARSGGMCIGSECMAWRWLNTLDDGGEEIGYCGIAGVPKG